MTSPDILSPTPAWLAARVADALAVPPHTVGLAPVVGDAGSRRYYRARIAGEGAAAEGAAATYIAVVDDSATQQAVFVRTRALFAAAARVPAVLAESENFLLLEDFGDTTYRRHLPADADALYTAAMDTLIAVQCDATLAAALPAYDVPRLNEEMQLFAEWYCSRHHARPLSPAAQTAVAAAQRFLAEAMAAVPPVAVHRDYHSRNLMLLSADMAGGAPGVLDFQDAVRGDALYDMVSLLRDAYIEWQPAQQQHWLRYYWEAARAAKVAAGDSWEECQHRFNIAGAQRGLKVLGIFARLAHRDGKRQYLDDLPLVHRHLGTALSELSDIAELPALEALAAVLEDYPP